MVAGGDQVSFEIAPARAGPWGTLSGGVWSSDPADHVHMSVSGRPVALIVAPLSVKSTGAVARSCLTLILL
eukprot:3664316-Pyramimonas_sp.AAC.1